MQDSKVKNFFKTLNDSNNQNTLLVPPKERESMQGGTQIFNTITPSDVGSQMMLRRRTEIQPDLNESQENEPDVRGGKDDFTQGGTNFGYQAYMSGQGEEIHKKQHLELYLGQPMRSLRTLMGSSNRLVIFRYARSLQGFLLFLWDTLLTFDSFVLLFHILVAALSGRADECWNIIYCVAAINIIGQAALNLFHDQKLKQASNSVNKLFCEKFVFSRRHKRFQQRPWDELFVGDIIKIKKNNQIPADCLILDIKSSNNIVTPEPVCYVKGGPWATRGEAEVKKSCQNTQNKTGNSRLSDSKFVQLLSGQLKWEYTNKGKYHGSLKLNENPAAFEFKNEHILFRGSSLYLTEQVICLVLNIGDECLGSVMRERQTRQQSFFNKLLKFREVKYWKYCYGDMMFNLRILQLLAISISFLSWIMILFVHLIMGETPISKFETFVMETNFQLPDAASHIFQTIFQLQTQYLLFYPYLVKIVIDCVIIFHNLFVKWDINLVPYDLQIKNYFALSKLSQVSNMVLSPSSVLGYRENVVTFFTSTFKEFKNVNPKLLSDSQEAAPKQEPSQQTQMHGYRPVEENLSDDSSQGSTDSTHNSIDYFPLSLNTRFRFENRKVIEIINPFTQHQDKNNDRKVITELLRACTLCHTSIQRDLPKSEQPNKQQLNCKSIQRYDEAQISFANSFKFNFVSRKAQMLMINAGGKDEKYEEMVLTQIDLRGVPMTVQVIRPAGSQDGCTMIFKAPLQAIKVFMKEELWSQLDITLQNLTKQGNTALTFAKRELDSEYAADLQRCISEVQTLYKGNKQRLHDTLMLQCENLDLIGILAVKPYLNYRNSMFMEEVYRNRIKVWLLSSQLEYETITQINAADFLSSCQQPLNVKGQSEKSVEESLKTSLKAASDRMQQALDKEKERMEASKNSRKSKLSRSSSKQQQIDNPPLEVVFTNGYALSIIMKDESMLKIFLILCSLCNCVVGSQVSATQKADLVKALKEYNMQANLGYVLSIIGNSSDMYMLNEADISIGLVEKYRSSDNMAITDLNTTELHSLTYILFKHASHLNRRLRALINFFFYRTTMMMLVITVFMINAGLSYTLPFQMFFTMIFMHIMTPLQYFLFGISHKDFGYDQFHRIYGEYSNNHFFQIFSGRHFGTTGTKALIDTILLCFFSIFYFEPQPVLYGSGRVVTAEAYLCYNSIILSFLQLFRMRDNNTNIKFFQPIYLLCFFLSVIFVLEDDNFIGLKSLFQAPAMIFQLFMMTLLIILIEHVGKVFRMLLPTQARESMLYYKNVEEMIFMEEYEDQGQEFQIVNNTTFNQKLKKQIKLRELVAINQNMTRLHRSDSMDQILERINITGQENQYSKDSKIVNRSTLINRKLKLHDFNKELEYQSQPVDPRLLEPVIKTLYGFILLIFCEILLLNTGEDKGNTEVTAITLTLSSLIVISIGLCVLLKRVKDLNYRRIFLFYIFLINIIINIAKSFTLNTQRLELDFMAVIALTFLLRLNSFFIVTAIAVLSMVCYCSFTYSNVMFRQGSATTDYFSQEKKAESLYRILNILLFLVIQVLYSYWDEGTRKISFVINYRKQKDYQKSKQILNILVPSIVRAQIQEGQKNFSEAQGVVTIVFCDIEQFDDLVQLYEGRELIELLDQTYNAFDQLCEQYGLQKIETVGKTYMACGGLKIVESKIDQRLLGNHYTVRVMDFTFEMLNVANSIKLKTGHKLKVKIGVHTGEVLCGVVGETKPQFSLIGDTVNKTSRVCSKCPTQKILISKETHKQLQIFSNNFQFEQSEVFMKGLGNEKVYRVTKKTLKNRLAQKKQTGVSNIGLGLGSPKPSGGALMSARGGRKKEPSPRETKPPVQMIDTQMEPQRTERSLLSPRYAGSENNFSEAGNEVPKQFGATFKEDRMIVENPALNHKYKLVERPRFLLQFNQKEQEKEFQQFLSNFYIYETTWFLIIKAVIDWILLFTIGWRVDNQIMIMQMAWVAPYVILTIFMVRFMAKWIINSPNVVIISITLFTLYFMFTFVINMSQSIFDSEKTGVYNTSKQQLGSYALLVFSLRAYQSRCTAFAQLLFIIAYTVHVITDASRGPSVTGFAEIISFIAFAAILIINSYSREMLQRKQYNNERIIDIEIEKTEDLLSKLVPFHVLSGIKNDQRVVDVLDNVTLLYTDMVGFTAFSNNVKNPVEVVQLLSKLFSKFDQLTDQHGVYKVHTIGDCYVIMGYTGKTPKYRRTLAVQIEEAYRVVKVGLEMIEIIREVRDQSTDPNLKSLDMRIGIHTGKIVGGVIGSKLVRYDIFGQDVLIANKMESNGEKGRVCISETTLALLKQNQFIVETLGFKEHNQFEVGCINKKITSYFVEQIFMSNSIHSSDISSHDYSSGADEIEERESMSESETKKKKTGPK